MRIISTIKPDRFLKPVRFLFGKLSGNYSSKKFWRTNGKPNLFGITLESSSLRACLKFHQSAASDKFCSALRYIFRRIARIRLQNMSCSEQNFPAFAQSWKFKHALSQINLAHQRAIFISHILFRPFKFY